MVDNTKVATFVAKLKSTFVEVADLVTSWSGSPSDTNIPSEKLVKDSLDAKVDTVDLESNYYTKTEADEIFSTLEAGEIEIVEKASANVGAFKTYQITQGGTVVSGEIDIPKDFLVKSGSIKTAGATPTSAESAAGVGANEKYISLIINAVDDESGNGTELIIPADGLVENTTYTADETTIVLSNTNEFSIKPEVVASWLTDSDVEDTVEDYLEAIAAGLDE